MTDLTWWKLHDAFTPIQAAALAAGVSPSQVGCNGYTHRLSAYQLLTDNPSAAEHFRAVLSAIATALATGTLVGHLSPVNPDQFELAETLIDKQQLHNWFATKGYVPDAFQSAASPKVPPYLDPNHPNYSHKLAAAVLSWMALLEEPQLMQGTTPKKAIEKWLAMKATEFKLVKSDESLNNLAIEEISKVCNWSTAGGASRTP